MYYGTIILTRPLSAGTFFVGMKETDFMALLGSMFFLFVFAILLTGSFNNCKEMLADVKYLLYAY